MQPDLFYRMVRRAAPVNPREGPPWQPRSSTAVTTRSFSFPTL